MKLRDHPLMRYHGMKSWPPVWVNTRSEPTIKRTGEIGTLTRVIYYSETPKRLFLRARADEQDYIGCLVFNDTQFCEQLNRILQSQVGRSIREIGDLDLGGTL